MMLPTNEDTQEFRFLPPRANQLPVPHSSVVHVDVAGLTNTGHVRPNNEDHFLVARFGRFLESLQTNLPADQVPSRFVDDGYGMVIADGIGGHSAGEQASRLAITTLINLVLTAPAWILRADDPALQDEILQRATERFEQIHDALAEQAADNPGLSGFGTTMTLAMSVGRNLYLANIGDSRAYLLKKGQLAQLTRDHTYAGEMLESGILTRKEAATHRLRNVLTRCLGAAEQATPDVQRFLLEDGDRLLLCSDGLNEMVNSQLIAEIIAADADSATLCSRLIDEALKAGGKDNVTVIVAQYQITDAASSSSV